MSQTPPQDGSLQSTRQMLDELDALMERMLSLPVNDLDDAPPMPARGPALSARLTVLEPPVPPKAEPPRSEPGAPHPPMNPPHLSLPPMLEKPAPPPIVPIEVKPVPTSLLPKIAPLLEPASEETVSAA